MKRSKVIITLLLIVSVHAPIYGFWTSLAAGFGSSILSDQSKEMFKDAIDFSDIMGDLKVVNEDTRDSVEELLKHTQVVDVGDTFIDFAIDHVYNVDPQISLIDYELQSASRILERYTGKNYHDEVSDSLRAMISQLEGSQKELQDYVPSSNNDALDKDYANYSNIAKKDGYAKADLKLQHMKAKLMKQLTDYEKTVAVNVIQLNNRERAKDIESEIKNKEAEENNEKAILIKESEDKDGKWTRYFKKWKWSSNNRNYYKNRKTTRTDSFKDSTIIPLMVLIR